MRFFTKRWFAYFLLYFCVGYIISFLIYTAYQATSIRFVLMGGIIFAPLWALAASYLYFRYVRNDWEARVVTAIGWIGLSILFSAVLVEPVYGYPWSTIINWGVINGNWMNVAAILIGGIVAKKNQA